MGIETVEKEKDKEGEVIYYHVKGKGNTFCYPRHKFGLRYLLLGKNHDYLWSAGKNSK